MSADDVVPFELAVERTRSFTLGISEVIELELWLEQLRAIDLAIRTLLLFQEVEL